MRLGEHVYTLTFEEAGMRHGISSAQGFAFLPLPLFAESGLVAAAPIRWVVSAL